MNKEEMPRKAVNGSEVPASAGQSNYTYILRCADGSLYTGWTNDLPKRVQAHNAGNGAKYTRSRRPAELVYYEAFDTKEEAMSREAAIKRLTRRQKEQLIAAMQDPSAICPDRK